MYSGVPLFSYVKVTRKEKQKIPYGKIRLFVYLLNKSAIRNTGNPNNKVSKKNLYYLSQSV